MGRELDPVLVQEADDLPRAALRVVLEDEVAGTLDDDELGVRDLALKAVGPADRRERVLLAPQDERRDIEPRQPPLVRGELHEVAGAVERELSAPLLLGLVRLPVLLDRVVVEPSAGLAEHRREAVALDRVDDGLARALGAKSVAETVPLAVGEEAGAAQGERSHGLGVVACP